MVVDTKMLMYNIIATLRSTQFANQKMDYVDMVTDRDFKKFRENIKHCLEMSLISINRYLNIKI